MAWYAWARALATGTPDRGIPGTIADTAVVPARALTLDPDDLAALRSPLARQDARQLLADAEALVPHPLRPPEPTP